MSNSPTLQQAVKALASVCDGAREEDGSGFSKYDADLGHHAAYIPQSHWSPQLTYAVWEMLYKYQRQLLDLGVDYQQIPAPPPPPGKSAFGMLKENIRRQERVW